MPGSQIEDKEVVTVFHGQGYLGLPDFMIAQRDFSFFFLRASNQRESDIQNKITVLPPCVPKEYNTWALVVDSTVEEKFKSSHHTETF